MAFYARLGGPGGHWEIRWRSRAIRASIETDGRRKIAAHIRPVSDDRVWCCIKRAIRRRPRGASGGRWLRIRERTWSPTSSSFWAGSAKPALPAGVRASSIGETRRYNALNQLTSITAGSSENLTYNYPSGTDNGKVSSMYSAISGETITYTYDSLNRLLTANGSGWGQQYGFDGFGNLLSKTVTAGSGPSLSVTVNPANNHIQGVSGLTYDANGNQSVASGGGYDAENRFVGYYDNGNQYAYDAQNKRIWNWSGALDTYGNATNYTLIAYSPSGQRLGAYSLVPHPNLQNGTYNPYLQVTLSTVDEYSGSRRLATIDQLGSAGTYFPWGEDKGSTNPQNTWSYATYWRDSASGLDYANNRYYSNDYGRFMTPDPYSASGGPADPQSWNRYAYTSGDPVNRFDPAGTCDITTYSYLG